MGVEVVHSERTSPSVLSAGTPLAPYHLFLPAPQPDSFAGTHKGGAGKLWDQNSMCLCGSVLMAAQALCWVLCKVISPTNKQLAVKPCSSGFTCTLCLLVVGFLFLLIAGKSRLDPCKDLVSSIEPKSFLHRGKNPPHRNTAPCLGVQYAYEVDLLQCWT